MAAASSSMIFYVRMEKVRGQGATMKESFALCLYSYVVVSVQSNRIEQELINSAPEMKKWGESQKVFMFNFEPVQGPPDYTAAEIQILLFCVCIKCLKETQKQYTWNVTNAFKGFLKGRCAIW